MAGFGLRWNSLKFIRIVFVLLYSQIIKDSQIRKDFFMMSACLFFLYRTPSNLKFNYHRIQFNWGKTCALGWSDFWLFIWQKTALNQRSGQILEVQIQIFDAQKSFNFQKNPGGLNINIFLWKSIWSFLLHKITKAEKIRNFSFKNYLFQKYRPKRRLCIYCF